MHEFVKKVLTGQFEAALAMLKQCIRQCPPEHWDARIGNDTFRQVAYHTAFWTDHYLSANESAFILRSPQIIGGDERTSTTASLGLSQAETEVYVEFCRDKAVESLAAETRESLEGPSGFSRLPISQAELHVYNIRHVQHHTGQLSAYLRKLGLGADWARSGWRL